MWVYFDDIQVVIPDSFLLSRFSSNAYIHFCFKWIINEYLGTVIMVLLYEFWEMFN